MNIRTLALRLYDRLITLIPGSRYDPTSLEARARRSVSHFSAEVDRATAIAQRRIDAAIVATNALEERITAQAEQALEAARVQALAVAARIEALDTLLNGK